MYRFTIIVVCLTILVGLTGAGLADIPKLINYQGMLTDDGGIPLTGSYNLTFYIYDDTTGGTLEWSEIQNGVQVQNGLFNVVLGKQNALNIPFDESYWLAVKVDTETMPRVRLTSVGYAYRARVADSATVAVSAPTGGGWTDDGVVVRLESGTDSVGIGSTNPSAKLDVSGDVNTSGSYKILGNKVLSVSSDKNTFVGVEAGESNTEHYGTFVGWRAGYNNQGRWNTFVGQGAGASNTGSANTFVGQLAGSNTTGGANTFLGRGAGSHNTSGYSNTFLGMSAGFDNTTGRNNTFVGADAGASCTTGHYNVYVGAEAGYSNVVGASNVFIGYEAGYHETGSDKLYIANGRNTGDVLIYGDFSAHRVGIGTVSPEELLHVQGTTEGVIKVGALGGNGDATIIFEEGNADAMALRYDGSANELRIDDETTDNTRMVIERSGKVGIGTMTPGAILAVKGLAPTSSYNWLKVNKVTGDFYYSSSSKRYKEDIQPLEDDFDRILQAEPRSFIDRASKQREIGYVAEEFDEMGLSNLVIYNGEGQPDGLKYELVSLYLLEVMKDQVQMLEELKTENEKLKQRIEALEGR